MHLSLYLSQRTQGTQRKVGMFMSSIVRLTDPAHISCPFGAEGSYYPQGVRVCRNGSFSQFRQKSGFNSVISACSNDRKGEGVRKNAFKSLSLAESAGYTEKEMDTWL
jgi:hypothetical protein